ncbi:MAG: EthD family reductase [Ktedonobacteraceae bacterium]|nr:EthD family reductase [Ktedonobacteraceae bacterium]
MAATTIVLYKEPANKEEFDAYYFEKHVPLVQKVPGLVRVEVNRFSGKTAPYYLMATLYFNSKEDRKAALASPEGQAMNADVVNFATPENVTVGFADVV